MTIMLLIVLVFISGVIGYGVHDMYPSDKSDLSGIMVKVDAIVERLVDLVKQRKENQAVIDGLNKQLKMLADEQLKANKRLKKLEAR